jgi:hypothetical protein
MPLERRPIPTLPDRPRERSTIVTKLHWSGSVGREEFTRAVMGVPFEVTFTTDAGLPGSLQAVLDTGLNAPAEGELMSFPFERVDERTFRCQVTPQKAGFFPFQARASLDGGASWLQGSTPSAWVMVDPPQVDGLRLYSLIPTASGTIDDWTADLEQIKAMGFNAVHLLPITPLDDSQSPYAAKELFGVDASYLAPGAAGDWLAQLGKFVERAKELEIRLCFDLVLNHVGAHSTMAQRSPSWIVPDDTRPDGNKRPQYWYDGGWHAWEDLVQIYFHHPSDVVRSEIWEYMIEYALFWGHYADYTGGFVRFDNLHGSDQEFVSSLVNSLSREYPKLAVLAEYFTDDQTLLKMVPEHRLNLVLATPWNQKYVPELRNYLRYIHRISEHIRYFLPVTSHDSGSTTQEYGTAESVIPRYVACALLGTGATGISQGVEWGAAERVNFIGRHPRSVPPGERRFATFLRKVNDILAEHPAFRSGKGCQFVDHDHHAVIAAFRTNPQTPTEGFLVVCNFDIHAPQQITLNLLGAFETAHFVEGRELLSGAESRYPASAITLQLPPCGAMVWQFSRMG